MKLWKFFNVSVTTVKSQCAWWDALHDAQEQRLLHCPVKEPRAVISPVDLLTMEAVLLHALLFCNMKVENFSAATFWCTRSSNQ